CAAAMGGGAPRAGRFIRRGAEGPCGVSFPARGVSLFFQRVLGVGLRMAAPVSLIATRLAYGASQLPRFAWYVGHNLVMRRMSEYARRNGQSTRPRARTNAPTPDRRRLYADMAELFRQDLANV